MVSKFENDNFVFDQGDIGLFPDCFAYRNGIRIGIEFELFSSHFRDHNHHKSPFLNRCNLIICWINNMPDSYKNGAKEFVDINGHKIEILSIEKKAKAMNLIKLGRRPGRVGRNEESFLEQLRKFSPDNADWVRKLIDYVSNRKDYAIIWQGQKRWETARFFLIKWGFDPINLRGNGSVEIAYQGNSSNLPWKEFPQETKDELWKLFNRKSTMVQYSAQKSKRL